MAFLSIDQNKMRDQIVVEGKRFALDRCPNMNHSATASSIVLDSLDIVAGSQLLLGELFLED